MGYRRTRGGGGSGGGGGGGMPIADPTGVTAGTAANPITGSGTYAWEQFPADTPVLAWGLAGDAFPRVVFGADPSDFGAIMLGDGTADPMNNGVSLYFANGQLAVGGGALNLGFGGNSQADIAWLVTGVGPVIVASDNSKHRIVVAADGTLSTTPLA